MFVYVVCRIRKYGGGFGGGSRRVTKKTKRKIRVVFGLKARVAFGLRLVQQEKKYI